ncbi:uncharacterized protein LOC117569140 [Drosophila albomicans]|uniref:Uncharacterized protein LOC117569140 n=1 Tax=Drosophila albomicans TaxID=7291 RepID=A0A6P8WQN8_DROAB|nr:uncharacterized protein LOC117569140 [Drosophila albomicans]
MCEYFIKVLRRTQLSHSQTDVKPFIYLHSKWLEDAVELQLYVPTSNSSYKAILKYDEIKSAAEELQLDYTELYDEYKKALTTQMGLPGFDYEVDEEKPKFKLWKCCGFEILYVDEKMRKLSNVQQMLDAAMECGQTSSSGASQGSSQGAAGAETQSSELVQQYEQYINDSKQTEKKLLKKFVMLLNTKKRRIEELESLLGKRKKTTAINDSTDEEMEPLKTTTDSDSDVEKPQSEDDADFGAATEVLTQRE